jgi:hypothetical protein
LSVLAETIMKAKIMTYSNAINKIYLKHALFN